MTKTFTVRITKMVGNRRVLIAEHVFRKEHAARDYARCYKAECGYTTTVK